MKLILDDFYYKGKYFDHYETEWPFVENFDEIPEGKITEYITESLDHFLEDGEA